MDVDSGSSWLVRTSPTAAYNQASGSLLYRMLQLMFGSLLVAYILSFVTFLTAKPPNAPFPGFCNFMDWIISESGPWHVLAYLFISGTYFIGTGGLYFAYHASILTLPTLQFRHLLWDFSIAGLQAVAFGLSMLYPITFLMFSASLLVVVTVRRQFAYFEFRNALRSQSHMYEGIERDYLPFDRALANQLRGEGVGTGRRKALEAWAPIARRDWFFLGAALGFGIAIAFVHWGEWERAVKVLTPLLTMVTLGYRVWWTVNARAPYIAKGSVGLKKMDDEYIDLLQEVGIK